MMYLLRGKWLIGPDINRLLLITALSFDIARLVGTHPGFYINMAYATFAPC